jgi:hypothetical protein
MPWCCAATQLRAHQQAVARQLREHAGAGDGNAGGWGVPMNE